MKEIKQGDTIMVPFQVLEVREKDAYPYYLGYGTARIHASVEMLERWQQEAGGEDSGKTYEDGMRDSWELAKKIICNIENGGLNTSELGQIFGYSEFDDVLANYTPQEAAEKIAEWESKKEIRIGDVVKDSTLENGYAVVSYVGKGSTYCVIWDDGSCGTYNKNDFVKTGRHIDIEWLLAQIGGTEDARDII